MTVWCVSIERRKGGGSLLGPFASRVGAIQAMRAYVERGGYRTFDETYTDEFGSSLAEGVFYSEEETIETYEREVLP